ncbi:MAG: DNA adenine methylase [Fimbriimonadaceae bacterium]|nr:DNA adenine methylase [Fimbriimonadaceae bacterium]
MVKYLGSKRRLLSAILSAVQSCAASGEVLDVFSGSARVGHHLKSAGYTVHANDHLRFAYALSRTYVEADRDHLVGPVTEAVGRLNSISPYDSHWFALRYADEGRYFKPENALRIAAVRDAIENEHDPLVRDVLLTSLMEAADRVDSTTGVQMAFLKQYAPRASNDLELRVPAMVAGVGSTASCADAVAFAGSRSGRIAYLDPPYNQHSYLGNYHIWETLCRWDDPEVYGVARKRTEVREHSSDWNSKARIAAALDKLLSALDTDYVVLSFNNEGYLDEEYLRSRLEQEGHVRVLTIPYKRYVGAKIGIYNPGGERVGAVGALENQELIYVLDRTKGQ